METKKAEPQVFYTHKKERKKKKKDTTTLELTSRIFGHADLRSFSRALQAKKYSPRGNRLAALAQAAQSYRRGAFAGMARDEKYIRLEITFARGRLPAPLRPGDVQKISGNMKLISMWELGVTLCVRERLAQADVWQETISS